MPHGKVQRRGAVAPRSICRKVRGTIRVIREIRVPPIKAVADIGSGVAGGSETDGKVEGAEGVAPRGGLQQMAVVSRRGVDRILEGVGLVVADGGR